MGKSPAWDDMRNAPHVRAAAIEIRDKFGIMHIGGFATSGHSATSDHYTGHALDVVTKLKGTEISNWAVANAARLSIKNVIWNRRIWLSATGAWKAYSGPSPHTDHVHLSFHKKPGDGSAAVDTGTAGTSGDPLVGCLQKLLDLFNPLA